MRPAALVTAVATSLLLAAPASFAQLMRDLPGKAKAEAQKAEAQKKQAPAQQPPAQQPAAKPAPQPAQSAAPGKKSHGEHGKKKGYYTKAAAKKKSGRKGSE